MGAGITGSLVVQLLTSLGYRVCVVDHENPGFASMAASTASLPELKYFHEFKRASAYCRKSLRAVDGLK